MAGIPWRFAGTSGLYGRPEIRLLLAVLRAATDPDSSVDVYALAASDVYAVPASDLSIVMATARRSHRSAWEVLLDAEDPVEQARFTSAGRIAIDRLVGDLRRLRDLAHRRPAGEVLYAFLTDSGWLKDLAAAANRGSEEVLGNIARFFDIVRSRSALLADDRAVFLVPHLATLVDAGDDPSAADPDPDVDAVSVLTVHKAKGLEFPVVFIPGLVAGRFPSGSKAGPARDPRCAGGRYADRWRPPPRRGAPPVLRGDDAGPRRTDPDPRRGLRRRPRPAGVAVRHRGARPANLRGRGGRTGRQRVGAHRNLRGRRVAAGCRPARDRSRGRSC